jgi:hypothetical protein
MAYVRRRFAANDNYSMVCIARLRRRLALSLFALVALLTALAGGAAQALPLTILVTFLCVTAVQAAEQIRNLQQRESARIEGALTRLTKDAQPSRGDTTIAA